MSMDGPYIWSIPEGYPQSAIGILDETTATWYFPFRDGEPAGKFEPVPAFDYSGASLKKLRRLGCLFNRSGLPLVDKAILSKMQDIGGSDFEALDCDVDALEGSTEEYKLINITNLSGCIDYDRSDVVFRPPDLGGIRTFRRLVLRPSGMGERSFSRERDWTGLLLVSRCARDELLKLGKPGLNFITADEFFPPPRPRSRQ